VFLSNRYELLATLSLINALE